MIALAGMLVLTACGAEPAEADPAATPTSTAVQAASPGDQPATPTMTPQVETPSPASTSTATATVTADPPEPTTSPTPSSTPIVEPTTAAFTHDEVTTEIDHLVGGVDGHVSIVVLRDDGEVLYEHEPDESMEAASVYKLPLMVEVFRQIEQGEFGLDTGILITYSYFNEGEDSIGFDAISSYYDVESLLFAMVAQSSNVAAYALLDLVGNDRVNATMADLGLDGIEIRWSPRVIPPSEIFPDSTDDYEPEPPPDVPDEPAPEDIPEETDEADPDIEQEEDLPESDPDGGDDDSGHMWAEWLAVNVVPVEPTLRADEAFNVVTARAVAELLLMILDGDAAGEGSIAAMLDLLAQQQIPGGLPAALPPGTVAHKTGYLEDGVINDAGIISTPAGKVVAVVLTEGVREDIAYGLMSDIGLLLYEIGSTER